jgi:hypothetical protein
MNFMSAGELGGSVALVDGVNVRVGSPGAPGCTTTGGGGAGCCAQTDSENKPASVIMVIIPLCQDKTIHEVTRNRTKEL